MGITLTIMTIEELRNICNKLIECGCSDFEAFTLFKNCERVKEIDREAGTVTFA